MPNFSQAVPTGEVLGGDALKAKIQQSIADEYEASSRYLQIAAASQDEDVKKLFADVAREEIIHAGEFRSICKKLFPEDAKLEEEGDAEAKKLIGEVDEENSSEQEAGDEEEEKLAKKDGAEKTKKKILKIISK